jgi:large subunit ribosomal protein L30
MADLKITLKRSLIGFEKSQRLTANALGLGKVGSSVTQPDTSSIRGMLHKLNHVLVVETADGTLVSAPTHREPRQRFHGPAHGPLGVRRK